MKVELPAVLAEVNVALRDAVALAQRLTVMTKQHEKDARQCLYAVEQAIAVIRTHERHRRDVAAARGGQHDARA